MTLITPGTHHSMISPIPKTVSRAFSGVDAILLDQFIRDGQWENVLVILPNTDRVEQFSQWLSFLNPSMKQFHFPGFASGSSEVLFQDHHARGQSLSVLEQWIRYFDTRSSSGLDSKTVNIVASTVSACTQLLPMPDQFRQSILSIDPKKAYPITDLAKRLVDWGYCRVETVREVGEFAIRGGIVDVFTLGLPNPIRLDFFGDHIETIKYFDILTQRSLPDELQPNRSLISGSAWDPIRVFPMIDISVSSSQTSRLVDYLPNDIRVIWVTDHTEDSDFASQIQSIYNPHMIMNAHRVPQGMKPGDRGVVDSKADRHHWGWNQRDVVASSVPAAPAVALNQWLQMLSDPSHRHTKILVCAYAPSSLERIKKVLFEHQQVAVGIQHAEQMQHSGSVYLTILQHDQGFTLPGWLVVTEQDLFGEKIQKTKRVSRSAERFLQEMNALQPQDLVVHRQHGVGQYHGLNTINVQGIKHDFLELHYSGGDKLYVPVENMDLISRYGGEPDTLPLLDKLGSAAWQSRQAKVKKRIREIAEHLLNIAAERELSRTDPIQANVSLYEEFCARFPYVETDDQAAAIQEVLDDMAKGRPMDRLICGDVGFGKTEIALRAAFVTATSGYQVAVVVPTTLLCRQHLQNFQRRFEGFPIKIAGLSRFTKRKQAQDTLKGMEQGQVDIVIGTHALLRKNLKFKKLGLLVIDEEQHFGVEQKEHLKSISTQPEITGNHTAGIHILTLSATPIPRTLQFSLAGVKDMSLLTTPPGDRHAVATFVMPFDVQVIREAMEREIRRGGQIFFVCPHIKDLEKTHQNILGIVPNLKVATAHGQMSPSQLDQVMTEFYDRKYDVLLATNIIESGLDFPNANTLFVHRSDRFGLSQLYQLRGRVGRSKQHAYAYFLIPPHQALTGDALRRLEAIQTLDYLGAGFAVASHDMDIRGAGNLLGTEQSGHIREVGIELYQTMLAEAVDELRQQGQDQNASVVAKDQVPHATWSPTLNLGLSVLIPEYYVPDLTVRLSLYRRFSSIENPEQMDDIRDELVDRFGSMPQEVENLFQVLVLKQFCIKNRIDRVDVGPKGIVISFYENIPHNPEQLLRVLQQSGHKKNTTLRPDGKLIIGTALHQGWTPSLLQETLAQILV